jgi:hypothetical protein
MTYDADLDDFLTTTVTYADHSSLTQGGAQTFGTSSTILARIEPGSKLVRDHTGREVVSEVTVFLRPTTIADTTYMPKVTGQITLPSPYSPTTPPIIRVRVHNDAQSQGAGVHHYEINL